MRLVSYTFVWVHSRRRCLHSDAFALFTWAHWHETPGGKHVSCYSFRHILPSEIVFLFWKRICCGQWQQCFFFSSVSSAIWGNDCQLCKMQHWCTFARFASRRHGEDIWPSLTRTFLSNASVCVELLWNILHNFVLWPIELEMFDFITTEWKLLKRKKWNEILPIIDVCFSTLKKKKINFQCRKNWIVLLRADDESPVKAHTKSDSKLKLWFDKQTAKPKLQFYSRV